MRVSRQGFVVLVSILSVAGMVAASEGDGLATPVFDVGTGGLISEWLLLGPFDSPEPPFYLPEAEREGYARDFLAPLGGEANAVIAPDTHLDYVDAKGVAHVLQPRLATANEHGVVDLKAFYNGGSRATYAFCYIESDTDQVAHLYFGWNDAIKVWLNGDEVVAEYWGACVRARQMAAVPLKKGLNPLLLKSDDAGGNKWEFVFEAYDETFCAIHDIPAFRQADQEAFLQTTPISQTGFVLRPGSFPVIGWSNPALASMNLGETTLNVTWYRDVTTEGRPRFKKAREATSPGRYLAVVEANSLASTPLRYGLTFYCLPQGESVPVEGLCDWLTRLPYWIGDKTSLQLELNALAASGAPELAIMLSAYERTKDKAALALTDRPDVCNNDAQMALRLIGIRRPTDRVLALPAVNDSQHAPVIRPGTAEEADVKPDAAAIIHKYCQEWYDETELPFAVVVARHGVVVIHEGFGISTDTPMWMASITKTITGLLFAQFMEQGLMNLDTPLGAYLPDLPMEGDKVITARGCFYHTTGMRSGPGDGIGDMYYDSLVRNALPALNPGADVFYSGAGYDLAGVAMQVVARKGIYRLFYENLFEPLGMTRTFLAYPSLGGGCISSATDMARLAQMLLNKGAYGNRRFFSPDVYEQLLPQDWEPYFPAVHGSSRGVGLIYCPQPRPGSTAEGDYVLSERLYGHGAASSAILRIDPVNDLVVVMTRHAAGPDFDRHAGEFLATIDAGLK